MHLAPVSVCLLASLWIFPVRAQDATSTDCAKAATQTAMDACAGAAFKSADAEMNAVYRQIIERLKTSDETKRLLVASQLAWLRFRDAECAFSANGVKGGTIYPTIVENCRKGLTAERLRQLKTYLNCEEGDMGCPVPPK